MIIGFIFWSAIALLIAGIGVWTWRSKKAAGFFTGVEAPKVSDVKKYNHAVAILWFVFAFLFELPGFLFLSLKHNSAELIILPLTIPLLCIGLMIAYTRILNKYQQNRKDRQP